MDRTGTSPLGRRMHEIGWSDNDLARRIDVSRPAIQAIRTGRLKPSPRTARDICLVLGHVLDLSPRELFVECFPAVIETFAAQDMEGVLSDAG